ncbi:NPC2 Phosphatidylglycerol/phosphatidylinositol transfer protein [Candida maltosa Xu316]
MVSFKNIALVTLAVSSSVQGLSFASTWDKAMTIFKYPTSFIPKSSPSKTLVIGNSKPVPGDSPIEICDFTESQLLYLNEVVLSPNPPEAGSNLTFTAIGYVDKTIEDGAYVEVEIVKVDLECPIKKGKHIITKVVEIPQEVPPGKYLVTARAYTKNDEYITCLTAQIVFPVQ